jgi:hypothetical protein
MWDGNVFGRPQANGMLESLIYNKSAEHQNKHKAAVFHPQCNTHHNSAQMKQVHRYMHMQGLKIEKCQRNRIASTME